VLAWHGSSPLSDSTGQDLARQALAGQQKAFRSIMLIGDLPSHVEAQSFLTLLNTYETANERFVYGRASIADRLPLAVGSSVRHVTIGAFGKNGVFVSGHPSNVASQGLGICGRIR
jgi:hypothetical protein